MYDETLQRHGREKPCCSSCFMLMLSAMAVGLCMEWKKRGQHLHPLHNMTAVTLSCTPHASHLYLHPPPKTLLFWIRTEIWVQLHHLDLSPLSLSFPSSPEGLHATPSVHPPHKQLVPVHTAYSRQLKSALNCTHK